MDQLGGQSKEATMAFVLLFVVQQVIHDCVERVNSSLIAEMMMMMMVVVGRGEDA